MAEISLFKPSVFFLSSLTSCPPADEFLHVSRRILSMREQSRLRVLASNLFCPTQIPLLVLTALRGVRNSLSRFAFRAMLGSSWFRRKSLAALLQATFDAMGPGPRRQAICPFCFPEPFFPMPVLKSCDKCLRFPRDGH